MTYWAALGLSGSALNPQIEDGARFVQWAVYAMTQGAAENDAKIRYNLDQFWKLKAAHYGGSSALERGQWDKLDGLAHGAWNALETGKIYSAMPSYGSYLRATVIGGSPARPEAITAASAATTAAQRAAQLAQQAQQPAMATYYTNTAASTRAHVAAAESLWNQAGMEFLGVPAWAWIAGAVGLGILIITRD